MSESTDKKQDQISLIEIIQYIQKAYKYLLSKWLIICIFGLGGGLIGLGVSYLTKPTFTAHLSFALVEKTSGGGLADLASSFGFGGSSFAGNSGAFSGDNLLEIMKSRHTIEKTLLTTVNSNNKKTTLANIYIEINDLRKGWAKNNKLKNIAFLPNSNRSTFTRSQDSILFTFYNQIINSKNLNIARKDKKLSFVSVDFKSTNEQFSKLFVEALMSETYVFYKETKTSQSRENIELMQHKADSVKGLYEAAMYKGASYSIVNINPALQTAAVPRIKQENDAQLYGPVYAEVLKNIETLKLDMARETPLVQIIDEPRFPLKKERLGKAKGIMFGGVTGGVLIVLGLLGGLFLKDLLKE